ncbi:MerR family transcriptional regulator [Paenibacillus glufosinatiresistens]|uniref:MerR family transcriptional regulator n=1 Tax=Paenibacillus glufosinatiresistens TaxID=3070657 RepID=UPI00286E0FF6|nr:MerR family transcriptional regulator [Paenibacillus sp. YX.27]
MYTIKEVAAMLDIPSVTLRAWESRYQAVIPQRTESGYRLYSQRDVDDLRWLKEQTEARGIGISHAVRLLKAGREAAPSDKPVAAAPGTPEQAFLQLRRQIYEALLEFQGERAAGLTDFGFSVYGYETMFHEVLAPVLVLVGDAWENGEATVAQEHYMTHFVANRFHALFHVFPVNASLPKAVCFCPAGERHEVGLLLFSLFLRRNGVEVIYLGADTPEEGVSALLREKDGIGAVCLSLTDRALLPYAEEVIARLAGLAEGALFIAGGSAFSDWQSPEGFPVRLHRSGENPARWQSWFSAVFAGRSRLPGRMT